MSAFKVVPRIHKFEAFDEFTRGFGVGERDIILTDRCIYENHLKATGLNCVIQDDYGHGEPDSGRINRIRAELNKYAFDRVIAIGGGSVIDIAKLMTLDVWNDCLPLFKKEIKAVRSKQLVIIPTTCGTGSEVTNISIAAFPEIGCKIGLADDALYADDAVLITGLLRGLPFRVFMHSSVDALIHSIESYLSPKASELSQLFSAEAVKIILGGYMKLNDDKNCIDSIIGEFLYASNLAGIAFSNAGCGLIHAMSYPIGGEFHLPHGEANYELLAAVMDFYKKGVSDDKLPKLEGIIAQSMNCGSADAVNAMCGLIEKLIPRKPMSQFGMTGEQSGLFAYQVIENQQRLLANSYIKVTVEDISNIYSKIL